MNRFNTGAPIGAILALLLASNAPAAGFSATAVTFAPGLEASVRSQFGAQEVPALRSQTAASVSAALKSAGGKCNLTVEVVIERVAPSHPTMQQQLSNPSQDPVHSRFANGGASLLGHLRAADGHELSTVKDEHFADEDFRSGSFAKDPWSDARVAINEFAGKLVTACEHQSAVTEGAH